jgi:hypothetical protein
MRRTAAPIDWVVLCGLLVAAVSTAEAATPAPRPGPSSTPAPAATMAADERADAAQPPPTMTVATAPQPTVAAPPAALKVAATPPPSVLAGPPPRTELVFYGWENMLVGEACIGIAFAAAGAGADEGGIVAIGYVIGGPIIHALNDDEDGAKPWISLGINLGLPLLGGLAGAALGSSTDSIGTHAAVGVLTGLFSAPLLDGIALGWVRKPVESEPAEGKLVVTPRLELGQGRGVAGVQGRF